MAPLQEPPGELNRFPRRQIRPDRPLYRIHLADRQGWWFSSDGSGRFDLPPPRGTRHLAEKPVGAFLETFRGITVIDERDIASRRISRFKLPRPVTLADCTSRRAAAFGVTGAIHSGDDYRLTQAWAAALDRAGFGGVRYFLSHDPSQRLVGVAVFGEAGARNWRIESTEPLGERLLREARRRFGILILPTA